jgi:hypothetical protein
MFDRSLAPHRRSLAALARLRCPWEGPTIDRVSATVCATFRRPLGPGHALGLDTVIMASLAGFMGLALVSR